ncbi:hypothetical protein DFJ74DRAFT_769188 [Hyaloraphidium curvatum]|nr:hypothetical protein DFJ74DRAFT_769188 [Hyaloraphidium curvatum]
MNILSGLHRAASGLLVAAQTRCTAGVRGLGPLAGLQAAPPQVASRFASSKRSEDTVLGMAQTTGRIVDVEGSYPHAVSRLNRVVAGNKIRDIHRRNREYEKPHDKRRRKLAEKEHRYFLRVMRERVRLAYNLKRRVEAARRNYVEI